ncbi:MAG: KH domain-containing protein [Chloroflexi bacterium]|nr:MAG: KH domain-containing protein [Chloroflexota bacterium]
MKELIEFMARAIVDNPDDVEVSEEDGGDHIVFRLKVADGDMGRVIGKQGQYWRSASGPSRARKRGRRRSSRGLRRDWPRAGRLGPARRH